MMADGSLQYRKRYEGARNIMEEDERAKLRGYNTASGMRARVITIMATYYILDDGYNTASGMRARVKQTDFTRVGAGLKGDDLKTSPFLEKKSKLSLIINITVG